MYGDDIMDKIEKRMDEILDELGKLKPTDPEYKKLIDELSALMTMKADQEVRDQNKYDSNYKHELEEERLKVENAKVEATKQGNRLNVVAGGIASLTTIGLGLLSYAGNKEGMADRSVWGLVNTFANKVSGWLSKSK